MKRIHKERDRLLRRLARVAGFVGTASALACLLIPGVATPAELAVGSVICVLVAVLVGLSTARGALLPAVGAAIVWVPTAIYFLATGAIWEGIVLIAFGAFVIGLVDNVLRPFLVGKDTELPDFVVLISTLGGIAIFGLNGFVIGPVIAAMFIAVWDIFSEQASEDGSASR